MTDFHQSDTSMQPESDPPFPQDFGTPAQESHGIPLPLGQPYELQSLYQVAAQSSGFSPADGNPGAMQQAGSSIGVPATFENAWSELQSQQQQLLEQQRQNLELQHNFSVKFNHNQLRQLELMKQLLAQQANHIPKQDTSIVDSFGAAEHPRQPSPFVQQSPVRASSVALTPEAPTDSATGPRKRQRRYYTESPAPANLYPQNDDQLWLLLQEHNSSIGAQENAVPYQSDASPRESYQGATAPYNTPGSFSMSPPPRPVVGNKQAENISRLDITKWSTLNVVFNDVLACEVHTMLDLQPREILHTVLHWVFRHHNLPEYFAGELRQCFLGRNPRGPTGGPDANRNHSKLMKEEHEAVGYNFEVLLRSYSRQALHSALFHFLTHENVEEIYKAQARGFFMDNLRVSKENLVRNADLSPIWAAQTRDVPAAFMGGSMGNFNLPSSCIGNVLKYLPLQDTMTLLLRTCRTLRVMFGQREIWSNVPIENKKGLFNTNGFLTFLQRLPETSICLLTLDLSLMDNNGTLAALDILARRKQWRIESLHVVGKKVGPPILNQVIRRIWSRNLRILSVQDVQGAKIDGNGASTAIVSLVPRLTHLRLEGKIDHESLKRLSSISTVLDHAQLLGSNRLTHLSLVGVRAMVGWDDIRHFGAWFPELEVLYLFAVMGSERWMKDFAIREPAQFEQPGNFGEPSVLGNLGQPGTPGGYGGIGAYGATGADGTPGAPGETVVSQDIKLDPESPVLTYRTPIPVEIQCIPIQRLHSLIIEHFGEVGDRKLAKSQEKIHMAYFWALVEGCKDSLRRLEIGPVDERFFEVKRGRRSEGPGIVKEPLLLIPKAHESVPPTPIRFPKLEYLFLSSWNVQWHCFVGSKPPNTASGSSGVYNAQTLQFPIHIQIPEIKTVIFFRCDGLPKGVSKKKVSPHPIASKWISELREIYPSVNGLDERSFNTETLMAGKVGSGNW